MTVSYSLDIATVNFTTVFKLFLRWKGSIVKVLFREGLVYFSIYAVINLIYRFALNLDQKLTFEAIASYCETYMGMIPTTFILGFYVSIVFTRWSSLVELLPWIDTPSMFLSSFIQGDAKSLLYRRSIMRYMVAATVMAYRNVSMQVRKRFPTVQHIVDSGLLNTDEMAIIDKLESTKADAKQWVPIQWCLTIVMRARAEGRITSDFFAEACVREVNKLRAKIGDMMVADSVCIPLIYTQVVTLAVWTYFFASLFARQIWIPSDTTPSSAKKSLDIYVPCFTILQFLCYVGWLRVAQDMLNPLGEADDDFELNAIIDRNLHVGMLMMDQNAGVMPELSVDAFIDEEAPTLPHTEASAPGADDDALLPSVFAVEIPKQEQAIAELKPGTSQRSSIMLPRGTSRNSGPASPNPTGSRTDLERGSPRRKPSGISPAQLSAKLSTVSGVSNPNFADVDSEEEQGRARANSEHQQKEKKYLETVDEGDEVAENGGLPLGAETPPPLLRSEQLELELREVAEREALALSPGLPPPPVGAPSGVEETSLRFRGSGRSSPANLLGIGGLPISPARSRTNSEPPGST